MSEEQVHVIALVTITEPQADGTTRKYHNGVVFPTTPERAKYYRDGGYARTPTEDEMKAVERLPQSKTKTRQMTSTPLQEPEEGKKEVKERPQLGRYNRRDQRAEK